MKTFNELLAVEEAKAANWAKEADGFEALYTRMVQDELNRNSSYFAAKVYARKNHTGFLQNVMLKVEF